jgi:hypothetical protein
VTKPKVELPLTQRVDRFKRRHPEIMIAALWATRSGKWEVSEPGCAAKAYDSGFAMMDDLERRYPPKPEPLRTPRAVQPWPEPPRIPRELLPHSGRFPGWHRLRWRGLGGASPRLPDWRRKCVHSWSCDMAMGISLDLLFLCQCWLMHTGAAGKVIQANFNRETRFAGKRVSIVTSCLFGLVFPPSASAES